MIVRGRGKLRATVAVIVTLAALSLLLSACGFRGPGAASAPAAAVATAGAQAPLGTVIARIVRSKIGTFDANDAIGSHLDQQNNCRAQDGCNRLVIVALTSGGAYEIPVTAECWRAATPGATFTGIEQCK